MRGFLRLSIDFFVVWDAVVSFDPSELGLGLQAVGEHQQLLPEVFVKHGFFGGGAPSAFLPLRDPCVHAVDEVSAVGVQEDRLFFWGEFLGGL